MWMKQHSTAAMFFSVSNSPFRAHDLDTAVILEHMELMKCITRKGMDVVPNSASRELHVDNPGLKWQFSAPVVTANTVFCFSSEEHVGKAAGPHVFPKVLPLHGSFLPWLP